jgi:BirA family biotin operon repressor/biotin-[acetyl-CoA-carboxylase] ligase
VIGKTIIKLETVNSTNLYLNDLCKTWNLEEGTLVVAEEQISGRGQLNNKWESKHGENLLMSFILYPHFLGAENQFMLSKIAALGVFEFLNGYLENVKIKWPNDIYVGDKKIAGILIENSLRGNTISNSIIGIGLNINQILFSKEIPNPTSMKLETKQTFDLEKLLTELCEKFSVNYNELKSGKDKAINNQYIANLYKHNVLSRYRDKDGAFTAKIIGIDESGRLCLQDSNNQSRKYAFKEVEFIN